MQRREFIINTTAAIGLLGVGGIQASQVPATELWCPEVPRDYPGQEVFCLDLFVEEGPGEARYHCKTKEPPPYLEPCKWDCQGRPISYCDIAGQKGEWLESNTRARFALALGHVLRCKIEFTGKYTIVGDNWAIKEIPAEEFLAVAKMRLAQCFQKEYANKP